MASRKYEYEYEYEYEIRRRGPDPARSVLLVIDMQEYFRDIASPILSSLQSTIALCRGARIPVVYTRHSHKDPSDHGMLGEWWPSLIRHGTPEAQLLPEVWLLRLQPCFFLMPMDMLLTVCRCVLCMPVCVCVAAIGPCVCVHAYVLMTYSHVHVLMAYSHVYVYLYVLMPDGL